MTTPPSVASGDSLADVVSEVVTAGLRSLGDLRAPDLDAVGSLGRSLHAIVAWHRYRAARGEDELHAAVVVAVRVACAHLDAGNLVDARLALTAAHDALPNTPRVAHTSDAGGPGVPAQTRAIANLYGHELTAHAVIQQATGILAARGDISAARAVAVLHRHADRHRFVLSGLAADVVAGRVPPETVLESAVNFLGT